MTRSPAVFGFGFGRLSGWFVSQYVYANDGRLHLRWLGLAAVLIGGCAAWAMHLLGILAYGQGVPLAYDSVVTLISLIIPALFAFFGLYCVFRRHSSVAALIAAGVIAGLGVASTHYTGMAASCGLCPRRRDFPKGQARVARSRPRIESAWTRLFRIYGAV